MVKEFASENNWAIVLGGSSGLGLASAKKLAEHGMNICIIHRDQRAVLSKLTSHFDAIRENGVELITFNIDATRQDKIASTIEALKSQLSGKVTCLIHSISRGNLKPMIGSKRLQNDDFHMTIDVMAISLYDWTQAIFNAQLFAKTASVISFTSEGSSKAWKNYAAVSAAKAALEAITRSIALEFAPHGLRANSIQAGVTDTNSLRMIPGHEELMKQSTHRNPNKRLTQPEDVANVVYLLCKKETLWINGTVIPVDGGEHIN